MRIRVHRKGHRPFLLILLFFIIVLGSSSLFRSFQNIEARHFVMGSDMEGYYQYLPYTFFKDWDLTKMRWARPFGEDRSLNGFTCGVAMMQLPFFLVAHGISHLKGLESNGYTPVYFMSVVYAAIFYVFIGLIFLYKSLLRYFEKRTVYVSLILVFLATNLYYYTVMSPGMSHAYSFCLVSLFIYAVPGFYSKPGVPNSLKMILPLAMAVLIRPTTIVAGFYFLLYDVISFDTLRQRLSWLTQKWYLLLLMVFAAFVVFIPQMLYWHLVTGKWIVYSYLEEGFDNALTPQIITVLFGARGGWYLYTPVMFVATIGLFYLAYLRKYSARAILLVMLIIIYINSSWWVPTFSASAGYRTLIEYYPFMAIPLAFLVEQALHWKKRKWMVSLTLAFFVLHNIQFAYSYHSGLWWDTEWQWRNLLRVFWF